MLGFKDRYVSETVGSAANVAVKIIREPCQRAGHGRLSA
jgi:hypothetical protein